MKRAAAAASSSATTQDQSPPLTTSLTRSSPYSTPDLPSNKRQKLDTSASNTPISATQASTPSENGPSHSVDEAARQRAIYLSHCGETEWVINLPPGSFPQSNGTDNAACQNDEEPDNWSNTVSGRQTYGNFKRKRAVVTTSADGVTSTSTPASSKRSETNSSSASNDNRSSSGETSDSVPPPRSKAYSPAKAPYSRPRRLESEDDRLDRLNLTRLSSLSGDRESGIPRHPNSGHQAKYRTNDSSRSKYEKSYAGSRDRRGFRDKEARRRTR